jgi:hypothetical protein
MAIIVVEELRRVNKTKEITSNNHFEQPECPEIIE